LALAYAMLIVYASLYPFEGWRWPPGREALAMLWLPPALHQSGFDVWSNVLGYLPLGLLAALALLRSGWRARHALPLALLLAAALSLACEWTQNLLPARVPTREDFALNSAGAALGVLLAWGLHWGGGGGVVESWSRVRRRWFSGEAGYALALLALWPLALLFPSPMPLVLGHGAERARQALNEVLDGVAWAEPVAALLQSPLGSGRPPSPLAEFMATALGLLAPVVVAFVVAPRLVPRLALALGALLLAVAAMTLSTALNFGPQHALAWLGPHTTSALAVGLVMALVCLPMPPRLVAGVGLVAITALATLAAQAGADPYLLQSLAGWEQGRFVRFHGLAQWLGWLWPYLALVWLLTRLTARPAREALSGP
jgi:VanZ family protein